MIKNGKRPVGAISPDFGKIDFEPSFVLHSENSTIEFVGLWSTLFCCFYFRRVSKRLIRVSLETGVVWQQVLAQQLAIINYSSHEFCYHCVEVVEWSLHLYLFISQSAAQIQ